MAKNMCRWMNRHKCGNIYVDNVHEMEFSSFQHSRVQLFRQTAALLLMNNDFFINKETSSTHIVVLMSKLLQFFNVNVSQPFLEAENSLESY